jgi:hypothetical protein
MTDITWNLEKRKLSQLIDYSKNPRRMTKEQADHLQKSIDRFGLIDKPILNQDNVIIAGHQRKNLLKKMKVKEVECWIPSRQLDEKEVEELNIRHNKNTGEWDFDTLANEFEIPELVEYGFNFHELGASTASEDEAIEPDDDPKDVEKRREIYQNNTIRQIVLYYDLEVYEDVLKRLDAIAKEYQLEDNSQTILRLLSFHEQHKAT